jgi:hypothetical protein
MPTDNSYIQHAEQMVVTLRQRRLIAGIKPHEIDQSAYLYESASGLKRHTTAERILIDAKHQAAVKAAIARKHPTPALAL